MSTPDLDVNLRRLDDLPAFLTVDEAAAILRLGRTAAYEAATRGELPTVRFGRRLRVPRGALLSWRVSVVYVTVASSPLISRNTGEMGQRILPPRKQDTTEAPGRGARAAGPLRLNPPPLKKRRRESAQFPRQSSPPAVRRRLPGPPARPPERRR